MAANIFGERFASRRKPAWHDIEGLRVFQEHLTTVEAFERSGLNYEVAVKPLTVNAYGTILKTDRVAIVRRATTDDPTHRVLGYAGKDYRVLPNVTLAAELETISKEWPVETAGALGKGETVFVALDAGEKEIGQDATRGYFVVANYHTGQDSLRIFFTRVRVVCQNTLTAGLRAATINVGLTHKEGVADDLRFHVNLLERMKKAQVSYDQAMIDLTLKRVSDEQVRHILATAYPMPVEPQKVRVASAMGDVKKMVEEAGESVPATLKDLLRATESYDYYRQRQQGFRDAAFERWEAFNDEFPTTAGTGWAIYNAVVETEDYRNGNDDTIGFSAVFGERAKNKERAFAEALRV